jgi:hypothetical protein
MDDDTRTSVPTGASLDLYWIPLGAGNRVVQFSGRTFEAIAATWSGRDPCDLYHTALVAALGGDEYFVEMTPVPPASRAPLDRGVVAEGVVGTAWARPLRIFRYEIRRWRNGTIPDLAAAVGAPLRLSDDERDVVAALDAVPGVPTPVWGRDQLRAGEMWNSNSVVSWILTVSGLLARAGGPPPAGRAPGWDAGVTVATRQLGGHRG